jgi:hypothetical protein
MGLGDNDETSEPHGVGAGGWSWKGARMTNDDSECARIVDAGATLSFGGHCFVDAGGGGFLSIPSSTLGNPEHSQPSLSRSAISLIANAYFRYKTRFASFRAA